MNAVGRSISIKILSQIYKPKNSYYKLLYDKALRLQHRQLTDEKTANLLVAVASKIVSIARPNLVLAGESICNSIMSSNQVFRNNGVFRELGLDPAKGGYLSSSDHGSCTYTSTRDMLA